MNTHKFGKLLLCLVVFFAAASGGAVSPAAGGPPPARSETPPPADAQGKAEEIRPKVGFVLQRVGDRYGPVLHYSEAFRLPGTSMRFGPYIYLIPEDEELGVPKWGYLLDNGRFFYLNEYASSDDDPNYALSGTYFVVDGSTGGSGINRTMYLFKFTKNSMKVLDRIEEDYNAHSPPAFFSDYPGEPEHGNIPTGEDRDEGVPVWIITEWDTQDHPLIKLEVGRDLPPTSLGPREFEVFHLYLKIVNDRLRVALDPDLYETIFRSLGEGGGPNSRSTEYYVSGFLAKKLSLASIKAELAGNKDRQWLLHYLRYVKQWDAGYHTRHWWDPMPRFVEYKLNRR